jgi:hypothetical protein
MIARWVLEDIIGVHGKNFDGERGKICLQDQCYGPGSGSTFNAPPGSGSAYLNN